MCSSDLGTLSPRRATATFPLGARAVIRFDGNIDGLTLVDDANLRANPISIYLVASIDAGERSAIFLGNYRDVSGYGLGISDSASRRVKWFTAPPGDQFDDGVTTFPAADLTAEKNYLITATFDAASGAKVLRILNESGTNSISAVSSASAGTRERSKPMKTGAVSTIRPISPISFSVTVRSAIETVIIRWRRASWALNVLVMGAP